MTDEKLNLGEEAPDTDATSKVEPDADGPLLLRLARKERAVKIVDLAGAEHAYVLRECTVGDKEKHQNLVAARMKGLQGGAAIVSDSSGLQADLILKCLHSSGGARVGLEEIKKFPPSAVEVLYDACQKLCGIGKYSARAQEEAKND